MMITHDLLEKLMFTDEYISYILEADGKYRDKIYPISCEFMSRNGKRNGKPYVGKEAGEKQKFAEACLEKVKEAAPECDNEYILQLLFWLYCVPAAEKLYEENGISKEIFYDTMKDLSTKTRECKEVHGKIGTSSKWFYPCFDCLYFALGRLQYYTVMYDLDAYRVEGYELNFGDTAYTCHIPSGERLTPDMCMESLDKAYEFFKKDLKDDILPVVCLSWLIYPNYLGKVFPEESNLEKFAKMFEVIDVIETGREFGDCARVFGLPFEGTTKGFPSDNSLRRNFIEYINSGAGFGKGIGILLYDGKKKEIVNKK